MDADTLRRVGEALEGERWQVPLARQLGVAERSVRYWLAGRAMPDGVRHELLSMLRMKGHTCAELVREIGGKP